MHTFSVQNLAFSREAELITAGDGDELLVLWSRDEFEPLIRFEGHQATVANIAVDPVRDEIATAALDGTIRIWDLATGATRLVLPSSNATDLAYTPDGRHLIAVSPEGATIVYAMDVDELVEIARDRLTRTWTEAECARYRIVSGCDIGSPTSSVE